MRALGIDLGSKRIGVALSDSAGTLAVPYEVVTRSKDRARDHRRLVELAEEAEVECIVVGMPYSLDGSEGPAARRARAEIQVLRRVMPVRIETYDERLSTVTADRSLREMQLGASARRRMVDSVAASVILQSWLDHRRAIGDAPDSWVADSGPGPSPTAPVDRDHRDDRPQDAPDQEGPT
ncbi:MAG: Holliday junction resolvase RuvX [Microthrixaceae bacterium]